MKLLNEKIVLRAMKKILILLFLFISKEHVSAQLYFPPVIGSTWDTIGPNSLGWCQDKIDSLVDYLGNKNTKAFILLKDGKIVIEHYYGTFTQDSLWYWASAGKSLTSFVVGIAKQEGLLNLSDSTSKYLGSGWTICPSIKEGQIKILNQLTMTSGLDDGYDAYCTDDTCLRYLADAGTRWAYHTAPYTLLDGVIQNATGVTLNSYLQTKIKSITGMTGNFYQSGYNNVFFSKARSMARFGLLMLNQGNWAGTQIMTDTSYFNSMIRPSQQLNQSYGYLWWLNGQASFMLPGLQFVFPGPLSPNAPTDMYAALGKNGQVINVVNSQNLVWIRMGDSPGGGEAPTNFNDSIWQKLNDVFCSTTSIEENETAQSSFIFSNPTSDWLHILNKNIKKLAITYEIIDMLGNKIKSWKSCEEEQDVEISEIQNGLYILRIDLRAEKLIVTH